jgi:hypothetical protein
MVKSLMKLLMETETNYRFLYKQIGLLINLVKTQPHFSAENNYSAYFFLIFFCQLIQINTT